MPFRRLLFEKRSRGELIRAEVYYTWRIKGRFTAESSKYKQTERIADVYKIQTERRLNATESFDAPRDLPVGTEYIHTTEILLGLLVPEFERLFDPNRGRSAGEPARGAKS